MAIKNVEFKTADAYENLPLLKTCYTEDISNRLGINVITILEYVCGKRGRRNLLIIDYKSVCF